MISNSKGNLIVFFKVIDTYKTITSGTYFRCENNHINYPKNLFCPECGTVVKAKIQAVKPYRKRITTLTHTLTLQR